MPHPDVKATSDCDVPFARQLDQLLRACAARVTLLGAVAAENACQERARLTEALRRRSELSPRWSYVRRENRDVTRMIDDAILVVDRVDCDDDLKQLYLDRLRELALESRIVDAVGTRQLQQLSRLRFRGESDEARALAKRWAVPPMSQRESKSILSDGAGDDSLLNQMRARVTAERLPFRVISHDRLSALAATGDETIYVAAGVLVSARDIARTVTHEVLGHAAPRATGKSTFSALFTIGTAGGIDDQEGLALVIEERHAFLDEHRKHELGARHRATVWMDSGATFAEVAIALVDECGLPEASAIRIAERIYRGSNGTFAGLGRERVYLQAYCAIKAHLTNKPENEALLASGQIGLTALPALRRHFLEHVRAIDLE